MIPKTPETKIIKIGFSFFLKNTFDIKYIINSIINIINDLKSKLKLFISL